MLNIGAGELAVLALIALFVLGPERLPAAIHWAASATRQLKSYLAAAKEQINTPEFDELRQPLNDLREPLQQLRAADPRRALRDKLRETLRDDGATPPSAPRRTPSASASVSSSKDDRA